MQLEQHDLWATVSLDVCFLYAGTHKNRAKMQRPCPWETHRLLGWLLLLCPCLHHNSGTQAWTCFGVKPQRRPSVNSMVVAGIESTPNPSSFLLRLSEPLEDVKGVSLLRGKTFSSSQATTNSNPESIQAVLDVEGVASVYAMSETITVNKHPTAPWEQVLPLVISALGGSASDNDDMLLMGILTALQEQNTPSSVAGQVQIRMQVSNKLPIQIEAIGFLGSKQRAKLSPKFEQAMSKLMQDKERDFFASRTWLDRGTRYPELTSNNDIVNDVERERLEMDLALQTELEEVDAAYSSQRISDIVSGGKRSEASAETALDYKVEGMDLETVDRLCDQAELGDDKALQTLAGFVKSAKGLLAARRNALAYLGGTGGRGGDVVLDVICSALEKEKSPAMRRTAGDALSDLGDPRAVPLAVAALQDRSKLVRWRAARVLGELADSAETVAVLKQSSLEEEAFEVAFELKDALRKVQARVQGGESAPNAGPVWKQIQQGSSSGGGS